MWTTPLTPPPSPSLLKSRPSTPLPSLGLSLSSSNDGPVTLNFDTLVPSRVVSDVSLYSRTVSLTPCGYKSPTLLLPGGFSLSLRWSVRPSSVSFTLQYLDSFLSDNSSSKIVTVVHVSLLRNPNRHCFRDHCKLSLKSSHSFHPWSNVQW